MGAGEKIKYFLTVRNCQKARMRRGGDKNVLCQMHPVICLHQGEYNHYSIRKKIAPGEKKMSYKNHPNFFPKYFFGLKMKVLPI